MSYLAVKDKESMKRIRQGLEEEEMSELHDYSVFKKISKFTPP